MQFFIYFNYFNDSKFTENMSKGVSQSHCHISEKYYRKRDFFGTYKINMLNTNRSIKIKV